MSSSIQTYFLYWIKGLAPFNIKTNFAFAKNRPNNVKAAILLSLTLINTNVSAKQSGFKRSNLGQSTQLDYQWQHKDSHFYLSFTLPIDNILAMPNSPANYSQAIFRETVYLKVMASAKSLDPKLGKVSIIKTSTGLSFNVSSRNNNQAQTLLKYLKNAHNQAQLDYWDEHFFVQYGESNGKKGIRHDHAKYTRLSSEYLTPVVDAIKSMQQQANDPREFIAIALAWIQSIPYNKLENRLSSNGAGFISPRDLLLNNLGDCDSKSTLLAALIKAYNSRIPMQMIYLPEHALLGVAMRPLPNERTIRQAGREYVLIEPTGPAQLAIGELPQSTSLALRNRQFDMTEL